MRKILFGLLAVTMLALGSGCNFVDVGGGQRAVVEDLQGPQPKALRPGFHILPFWTDTFKYSVQDETYTFGAGRADEKLGRDSGEILAKASDKQKVWLSGVLRYRLDPLKIIYEGDDGPTGIHTEVADDYEARWVEPTVTSVIKGLIDDYEATEVFAGAREEVRSKTLDTLRNHSTFTSNGIIVEDFVLDLVRLEREYEKIISKTMTAKEAKVLAEQQRKTAEEEAKAAQAQAEAKVLVQELSAAISRLGDTAALRSLIDEFGSTAAVEGKSLMEIAQRVLDNLPQREALLRLTSSNGVSGPSLPAGA